MQKITPQNYQRKHFKIQLNLKKGEYILTEDQKLNIKEAGMEEYVNEILKGYMTVSTFPLFLEGQRKLEPLIGKCTQIKKWVYLVLSLVCCFIPFIVWDICTSCGAWDTYEAYKPVQNQYLAQCESEQYMTEITYGYKFKGQVYAELKNGFKLAQAKHHYHRYIVINIKTYKILEEPKQQTEAEKVKERLNNLI